MLSREGAAVVCPRKHARIERDTCRRKRGKHEEREWGGRVSAFIFIAHNERCLPSHPFASRVTDAFLIFCHTISKQLGFGFYKNLLRAAMIYRRNLRVRRIRTNVSGDEQNMRYGRRMRSTPLKIRTLTITCAFRLTAVSSLVPSTHALCTQRISA